MNVFMLGLATMSLLIWTVASALVAESDAEKRGSEE
jgi:hypothetical protein